MVLFLWNISEGERSAPLRSFVVVAAIAAGIHFLAFLMIGLPIFLRYHRFPQTTVWKWREGLVSGTLIGMAMVPLVMGMFYGGRIMNALVPLIPTSAVR